MQLIKMERLNTGAAPKVITTFMNMRRGSQGIMRLVFTVLITLSDSIFHITEHVLFQACRKGTPEETQDSEDIIMLANPRFLQQ